MIRLKALSLLLLFAVSVFPFKIFCHNDDSEIYKSASFSKELSHHDCSFCSFHFYNEFEGSTKFSLPIKSFTIINFSSQSENQLFYISNPSKNRGPPIQFL